MAAAQHVRHAQTLETMSGNPRDPEPITVSLQATTHFQDVQLTFSSSMPALHTGHTRQRLRTSIHLRSTERLMPTPPSQQQPRLCMDSNGSSLP